MTLDDVLNKRLLFPRCGQCFVSNLSCDRGKPRCNSYKCQKRKYKCEPPTEKQIRRYAGRAIKIMKEHLKMERTSGIPVIGKSSVEWERDKQSYKDLDIEAIPTCSRCVKLGREAALACNRTFDKECSICNPEGNPKKKQCNRVTKYQHIHKAVILREVVKKKPMLHRAEHQQEQQPRQDSQGLSPDRPSSMLPGNQGQPRDTWEMDQASGDPESSLAGTMGPGQSSHSYSMPQPPSMTGQPESAESAAVRRRVAQGQSSG
jgi:hypothetical protein